MSRRRHHHGLLFVCVMPVLYPAWWVLAGTLWFAWKSLRVMSFLVFGRPRIVPLGGLRRALTGWLQL